MGFELAVCVILAVAVRLSSGAPSGDCPHLQPGQASFASLYPSLQKSSVVTITRRVLLDVPLVDVTQITIEANGKLVFDVGYDIVIKTKGILVRGALIIGDVDCRHTDNVHIVLEGQRSADQSAVGHEGEKFIAVEGRGELYIHGAEKLAWTKLAATVDRFDSDSSNVKYIHSTSDKSDYMIWCDGPAVYVLDSNADVVSYHCYNVYVPNWLPLEVTNIQQLITDLNSISDGNLVALAIQNSFRTVNASTDDLLDTIEAVAGIPTGDLLLRDLEEFDAYALIFVKGQSNYAQIADKLISKETTFALASFDFAGYKISAESYIEPDKRVPSYVEFRVLDPSVGYPLIQVLADISSWNVGDVVALTSTDYDPFHGETVTIKEIVTSTSFRASHEVAYRHCGQIENVVDMRGEVAMLTRNIKIEGEMSRGCPANNGNCAKTDMDTFGGQLIVMHDFDAAYIQGTEFTRMGQSTDKGRYPVHFHLLGDISDRTAIVEGNSIHHTFQRCVTVHGTFGASQEQPGVEVMNNVCYDVYGHGYFLEDGAEPATILTGNLAANVRKIDNGFFETDLSGVAGFWITSPKTVLKDNVAGGGDGFGIWYLFPLEPVGPSADFDPPVFALGEAMNTPCWTFDNNVVHSNLKAGLQFDKILLDADGNVDGGNKYHPVENPLDWYSTEVPCQITRLTAYKNLANNVWARGGIVFDRLSSAESKIGLFMARGDGVFQQFAKNSVFMGQSTCNAEVAGYPDAYTPQDLMYQFGVGFIYGPQYISYSFFTGFNSAADSSFVSGALSFRPAAKFTHVPLSGVHNLRFGFDDSTDGNRMFVGNADNIQTGHGNNDGDELHSIRDLDGSLTACSPSDFTGVRQVVKPEKFLLTDNCECRENWKMCICSDLYGMFASKLKEVFTGSKDDFPLGMQFERVKNTDSSDRAYEDHSGVSTAPKAVVGLGIDYFYNVQFKDDFPKKNQLEVQGIESGKDVVVGYCMPDGTTESDIKLWSKSGQTIILDAEFVWVSSLQAVRDDDSMQSVYLDGRMLYMHFTSNEIRDPFQDTEKCLGGMCPSVFVTLLSEPTVAYTPCFNPTPEQLGTDNMMASATEHTCLLPSPAPDVNWGAGDTTVS